MKDWKLLGSAPRRFGACCLLSAVCSTVPLWAQDATPQLPDTVVEADRAAPSTPAPTPPQPAPYLPYPSVLTNSVFAATPTGSSYAAEDTTAGTIIAIPRMSNPNTVSVIPQALIQDQQILNFQDVVRNSAGTVATGDPFFPDRIFIRGQEVRAFDYRKDGFFDPTNTPRDFVNIERVEILKGPASVTYGNSNPSGTVNLVTKKPLDASFQDFGVTFGSFGQQRYVTDVNGYGASNGDLLFRVNAAYENADSFRDGGFLERTMVAPGLTWVLDSDTTLTWLGEYHRDRRIGDRGFPAVNGDPLALPPSRYVGEPDNDFSFTEDFRQTLILNHRIDNNWNLSVGGMSLFYQYPGSFTGVNAPIAGTLFNRDRTDIADAKDNAQSVMANLSGDVCLGGSLHRVLIGAEYNYYDSSSSFTQNFAYAPIDVANPVYLNPPSAPLFDANFPVFRQNRIGVYVQDFWEIDDYWQVLAGLRYDSIDVTFDRNFAGGALSARTQQTFDSLSPRAGVVFQPVPDVIATYYNFSRSFAVPGGQAYILPAEVNAERGEMHEVGVRTRVTPGFFVDVAAFHITRQNTPFYQFPFAFQVGEVRSQGVEVAMQGQVTERLNLIATYAYTDSELNDPLNPAIFGQRQRNVPYNSGSMWARYNFVQECCRTYGAALGFVAMDDRLANLAGDVTLPGYFRVDAGLFANVGQVRASLYFENLFDTEYAAGSADEFQIFPGAPFNLRGQLAVRF